MEKASWFFRANAPAKPCKAAPSKPDQKFTSRVSALLDDIKREMQKDDKSSSACSPAGSQSEKSLDMISRLRKAGYISKEMIGRGTYSTVRRAYSERHSKDVALKIVDKRSRSDFIIRFLPRELDIVPRLHHQNVVEVFEIIESESIVCIAQEYAAGGDLLKKIKKQSRIDEGGARFHFRQLIEALMYLKKIEVIHRDLKCENLLLDLYDNIKLGDFGFSRMMRNGDESHTFCGSRAYVAPEVLRSRSYSGFTVDLWSAGVVLFVMVTGLMPYDDRYPRKMVEKQMQHRVTFPSRITLSDDIKQLIFAILHPVPSKRIPYHEILQSPWLASTPYQFHTSRNTDQHSPSTGRDISE